VCGRDKIFVVNNSTVERLETYLLVSEHGSGQIRMNGGAAHRITVGEEIIVMAFEISDTPIDTTFVLVDKDSRFDRYL
jgi:aspartate 1-decarboxylase